MSRTAAWNSVSPRVPGKGWMRQRDYRTDLPGERRCVCSCLPIAVNILALPERRTCLPLLLCRQTAPAKRLMQHSSPLKTFLHILIPNLTAHRLKPVHIFVFRKSLVCKFDSAERTDLLHCACKPSAATFSHPLWPHGVGSVAVPKAKLS